MSPQGGQKTPSLYLPCPGSLSAPPSPALGSACLKEYGAGRPGPAGPGGLTCHVCSLQFSSPGEVREAPASKGTVSGGGAGDRGQVASPEVQTQRSLLFLRSGLGDRMVGSGGLPGTHVS